MICRKNSPSPFPSRTNMENLNWVPSKKYVEELLIDRLIIISWLMIVNNNIHNNDNDNWTISSSAPNAAFWLVKYYSRFYLAGIESSGNAAFWLVLSNSFSSPLLNAAFWLVLSISFSSLLLNSAFWLVLFLSPPSY